MGWRNISGFFFYVFTFRFRRRAHKSKDIFIFVLFFASLSGVIRPSHLNMKAISQIFLSHLSNEEKKN